MFCISACFAAKISIHALRVEGDITGLLWVFAVSDFYPRPPGGGRRVVVAL